MTGLVFIDIDDTLLSPPYAAVRKVSLWLGKDFPSDEEILGRSHIDFPKAFPSLFRSTKEMWAIALMALPFGYFRSQNALQFDIGKMAAILKDHRVYLISKNPPIFTRWRIKRLQEIFGVNVGDRYIACQPMFNKGQTKISVIKQIASHREVPLSSCMLIDDSLDNIISAAEKGVQGALVQASWNTGITAVDSQLKSCIHVISTPEIPAIVKNCLGGALEPERAPTFIVPPLSVRNAVRILWQLLKRSWIYREKPPSIHQIIAVARNPITSLFFKDPHAIIRSRIYRCMKSCDQEISLRILPLASGSRSYRLPLTRNVDANDTTDNLKVRRLRGYAKKIMAAQGHKFLHESLFYYVAFDKDKETQRILGSERLKKAKERYVEEHGTSSEHATQLTKKYVAKLTTNSSYFRCLIIPPIVDVVFSKIFRRINFKDHPDRLQLDDSHFMLYAAAHRSYLDSAVLWHTICKKGTSFPFTVGAEKMRTVWFCRLAAKAGAFFIKRKAVDCIYEAVMAEQIASMQKPGSSFEVFLEGQRSRSGLTLPPKKGIASIIWRNMEVGSKVAIIPVSFAYNAIPESEKLVFERFEERKKLGIASLRELAEIRIQSSKRKILSNLLAKIWQHLFKSSINDCHINFAEPIILKKSEFSDKLALQNYLNETMLRINNATEALPSSMLCLFLLGCKDQFTTSDRARDFLELSHMLLRLYDTPSHLKAQANFSAAKDIAKFIELPFINARFKREKINETEILSVDSLNCDRAVYHKNNVLHFFVLPAILCQVFASVNHGHIEELHRCFSHLFEDMQKTYFLPQIKNARNFIDGFLSIMERRGLIVIDGEQWSCKVDGQQSEVLEVLANLGADIVKNDLPNILDAIRRSSKRRNVSIRSHLSSASTMIAGELQPRDSTSAEILLECKPFSSVGDTIEFHSDHLDKKVVGTVSAVNDRGLEIECSWETSPFARQDDQEGQATRFAGTVTLDRAWSAFGTISNLSENGAFVRTSMRLQNGSLLQVSLGDSAQAHVVKGRVARITEEGVGIAFENLSDENKARIVLLSIGDQDARP